MNITCLTVGLLECGCYLASDGGSGACVVIDPGGNAPQIIRRIEQQSLEPLHIVLTHAHANHIAGLPELKARFPDAEVCIGCGDAEMLADSARNLSAMLSLPGEMPHAARTLAEGDTIQFGDCALRVLETPGHTPGGICLIADAEEPPVVFCGDLVFQNGVGRTDFPGGSLEALRRSIEEKIFTLPEQTVLHPGHGPSTTVGAEKRSGLMFW